MIKVESRITHSDQRKQNVAFFSRGKSTKELISVLIKIIFSFLFKYLHQRRFERDKVEIFLLSIESFLSLAFDERKKSYFQPTTIENVIRN